jgi:hypothetical protein
MKQTASFLMCLMLLAQRPAAQTNTTRYTAPDRAFSISIPSDWKVERENRETGWMTMISNDSQPPARLVILTNGFNPPNRDFAELRAKILADISAPHFQGWIEALKENSRVSDVSKPYSVRVSGIDARRLDLTYRRGDRYDPRKGYAIFLFGKKTSFFVTLTGSGSAFDELEKVFASWQVEP